MERQDLALLSVLANSKMVGTLLSIGTRSFSVVNSMRTVPSSSRCCAGLRKGHHGLADACTSLRCIASTISVEPL